MSAVSCRAVSCLAVTCRATRLPCNVSTGFCTGIVYVVLCTDCNFEATSCQCVGVRHQGPFTSFVLFLLQFAELVLSSTFNSTRPVQHAMSRRMTRNRCLRCDQTEPCRISSISLCPTFSFVSTYMCMLRVLVCVSSVLQCRACAIPLGPPSQLV